MGKIKIGINGFGRIGRNAFKIAFERSDIEIIAINDLTDAKTLAYLLKHDNNYGTYQRDVTYSDDEIIVGDQHIKILARDNPAGIPWGDLGVDIVIESTGRFTTREYAAMHIEAGAKKVVIGSPARDEAVDIIVIGVNEDVIKSENAIISNASPTTNSVGSLLAILDGEFGVQKSMLITIHSYTSSQTLVGSSANDLREGRSASENIVPSTTSAVASLAKALPQLEGKIDGLSVRVPTSVVSLSDVTVLLGRNTTANKINEVITRAVSEPFYQGILGVSNEPLVSRDYIGNSHSGVVDLLLTKVVGGNMAKIMVWYDNEWGYCNRLVELVADIGRGLHN